MPIVKYKNQSGITYAYEQTSKWDPVKKQARPVRKYLGRVDEETGEIIKTSGRKGRSKKENNSPEDSIPDADYKRMYQQASASLEKSREKAAKLQEENEQLVRQNAQMKKLLHSIYLSALKAENSGTES